MEHDIRYQRPVRHIERAVRPVVPQRTRPSLVSKKESQLVTKEVPIVTIEKTTPSKSNAKQTSRYSVPAVGRNGLVIRKKLRNFLRGPVAIYGMAFIIFGIGIVTSIQSMLINKTASDQVKVLSASSAESSGGDTMPSGVPSEEEPKGDYKGTYRVAPSLPRLLAIPSIGVKARVLQVGVDANNRLGTPKNIYDTAWYSASSKPGEMGAVLIDGHYSGPNTRGVFSKLERLRPGDTITLERGDGTTFTYTVAKIETKPENEIDMSQLLVSVDTNAPGLNLITCGGDYDVHSATFNERTVVYATQK